MDELNRWCENEGLEWNKSDKSACGYLNGYPFFAQSQQNEYFMCVFCSDKVSTGAKSISEYTTGSGMLCSLVPYQSGPGIMHLTAASQRLCVKAVQSELMPSACRECGGGEHLRVWKKGEDYTVLCIDCREKLANEEKLTYIPEQRPKSANIVGALIGALVAMLIYVVMYQIGDNLSALLGAIAGFVISRGCLRDKNNFSKQSAWMCVQIGIFTLIIAQLLALSVTLYLSFFWQGVTLLEAMQMLPQFLTSQGVMLTLMKELALAIVPMALIVYWWYIRTKRRKAKEN